ncbi:MAG: PLP-dependent aminotransferase family protein [Planctomycetes bacterium]|nr:PLP-dependent aminotransferase family protein [Planctomycetota bacterium]
MRGWEIVLPIDDTDGVPLFVRIARAVSADVLRGRLRPGDRLPGSRTLARTLGVHRNTVLAAYQELEAEGLIAASRARGTFVSRSLPEPKPRKFATSVGLRGRMPAKIGFALRPPSGTVPEWPRGTGIFVLSGGKPDVRLVPHAALVRAYRRVLRTDRHAALGYGDPRGDARLRAALAAMLSATRRLAAGPDNVIVTRGSQMALGLIARALVEPGDVVAVESWGYRPAWEAFRYAGARLVALPVDDDGVRVDALESLLARERVRAVYVTPHHQCPTTVRLDAPRRLRLLELADERGFAIVEDDYDHEFHYEGRPVLPLASADGAGVVVYVGTLSKVFAPGLRLGYIVAPTPCIDNVASHRETLDVSGDPAVEAALADLLEDGEIQRHVRRMRRVYATRRNAMVAALRKELGDVLSFELPSGGMALWCRVDAAVDVEAWAAACLARGVYFQTGKRFAFDGRAKPFVRFGFAAHSEDELREAVRRMAAALPAARRRR